AVNIALFTPDALRSRKHRNPRHGLAETRDDGVTFRFGDELHSFKRSDFLHNGRFPIPA
ncbi:MAG: RES domain-containing protein, partial [Woeseia sp.]|nr:RES domain-containing protein [Woeseia sp.]